MSLREFDSYMREGGFKYSFLVISHLEEAAGHIKKAKKTNSHAEYGLAYDAQVAALESAEFEKQYGPTIEPVIDYMPTQTEKWLRETQKRWQDYLAKID